eukprot:scaffold43558_cov69-Phaeocystis_antarctica.AAC.5
MDSIDRSTRVNSFTRVHVRSTMCMRSASPCAAPRPASCCLRRRRHLAKRQPARVASKAEVTPGAHTADTGGEAVGDDCRVRDELGLCDG